VTHSTPALDTVAAIETPEHIHFTHRIAGPPRRAMAWLVDGLVKGSVLAILYMLLPQSSEDAEAAASGLMMVFIFFLEWGYNVLFETAWNGKTPGKAALQLRVVKESGGPITIVDSIVRNLLRAADFLPMLYAVGVVVSSSDRWFRRIGDMVAGTMVIVETHTRLKAPLVISPKPTEQELAPVPRRPPLSHEELNTIEYFLRRSEYLGPGRTEELANIIAPMIARRMELPPMDPARMLALVYHRARLE